eukprot:scaffold3023_cov175-Amphora_coffeaeformis.AAC.13
MADTTITTSCQAWQQRDYHPRKRWHGTPSTTATTTAAAPRSYPRKCSDTASSSTIQKYNQIFFGWHSSLCLLRLAATTTSGTTSSSSSSSSGSSSNNHDEQDHSIRDDNQQKQQQPYTNNNKNKNTMKTQMWAPTTTIAYNSNSVTATPYSREELAKQVQVLRDNSNTTSTTSSSSSSSSTMITPSQCNAVLASCVAADAWDTVLDVLDLMKDHGWGQTHDTYTASLAACAAVGNAASAYEIWQAMQQAAVVPNGTDVGLLLSTLCGQARFESKWYTTALQVWDTLDKNENNNKNYVDGDDDRSASRTTRWIDDMPISAVDAVLREMAFRKEWRRSLRIVQTILDRQSQREDDVRHQPSPNTFRWTVEACLRAGQPEQAAQILSSSLTFANKRTQRTGSGTEKKNNKSFLHPETTVSLFAQVISGLAKKQQWRKALQMLDLLEQQQSHDDRLRPTVAMYNAIMVALGKAKEFSQAKRLMRRLKAQDLFPDILTYNSLMAAAAHRWKEALTVLDECHREPGVNPDVYTYTNAIRACAKGGKISQALTLLRVVQDKELPLDAYVYTAAMEACAKGKLWERALGLLQEMQEKGIQPTKVTYSVAITACGNAGEWERSLDLLDTMRSKGLSPNLITYNGAIAAIAKSAKHAMKDHHHAAGDDDSGSERWSHVKKILNQMEEDGLEPDGFSFSSAISCCGSEGRWEEALELMEKMRQGGPATRPNKIAYTAAITSCGRNGKDEHALKLFAQMKEEGLEADRVAYNALFSALRVSKRPDVALELWDEMLGVQPSRTLPTRKRVMTARTDDAVTPDIITVTDAIGALSADDSLQGRSNVDRVLKEAVERGILLRSNRLDSFWEVDLSGMSLPVARAATRYILGQIATLLAEEDQMQDLTLITGVGVGKERSTSLREYIQEILKTDFDPPMESSIPPRAQGTVLVEKSAIAPWLARQQQKDPYE